MLDAGQSYHDMAQELLPLCSELEKQKLKRLEQFEQEYKDHITELFMKYMFNQKLEKLSGKIRAHGGKKSGSHNENRHK